MNAPIYAAERAIAQAQMQAGVSVSGDYAKLLEQIIRQQAKEAARLEGDGLIAQPGCELLLLTLGDTSVLAEVEYEEGEPSQTSGPPERCYEGTPESVCVIQVLIKGAMVDVDGVFCEEQIERWQEEACEHIRQEQAESYADAMAERAYR
jgi:hypothetical protein